MMVLKSLLPLATLLPLALASPAPNVAPVAAGVPARRDGTSRYRIHPYGDSTMCLCTYAPGINQPVLVRACGQTYAGYDDVWQLEEGDNLSVGIGGTGVCLDAGSTPANNGLVHLWTCYPGVQQQQCVLYRLASCVRVCLLMHVCSWYYTNDQHLAITGGNQCLDSGGAGATQVQTYQVRVMLLATVVVLSQYPVRGRKH
jgi:hypothetical protein